MPFEHRNETELLTKGGFHLVRFDKYQVGFGDETYFGQFYAVHNGEQMVQSASLDRAEEIMGEFLSGSRSFDTAEELTNA